jgi:hypothetical protein
MLSSFPFFFPWRNQCSVFMVRVYIFLASLGLFPCAGGLHGLHDIHCPALVRVAISGGKRRNSGGGDIVIVSYSGQKRDREKKQLERGAEMGQPEARYRQSGAA